MLDNTLKIINTYRERFLPHKKEREPLSGILATSDGVILGYSTHYQEATMNRDMLLINSSTNQKEKYCGISGLNFSEAVKIIERFKEGYDSERDGKVVKVWTDGGRMGFVFDNGDTKYASLEEC